ncbi:MAG: DinB family protein, partial [Pseudomonadota bacterium]
MITNDYLRSMARYNRWQNGEIYGAAARLSDGERCKERGAFFGSIHGTLSHLYWADRIWLSRFDLIEVP